MVACSDGELTCSDGAAGGVAFAYHMPPALALAAAMQAVGDVRGDTVATAIAGAGFLLAARAAVASGATTSEAALSPAASDDARCRFCGGADLENGFSLEAGRGPHVRRHSACAV